MARQAAITDICVKPDCDRRVKILSRALCALHYQRWRRAMITQRCRVIGCGRKVENLSSGLCHGHYGRWLRARDQKDFRGLGILACHACGRAYLTHDRWPCPHRDEVAEAPERKVVRSGLAQVRTDVGA